MHVNEPLSIAIKYPGDRSQSELQPNYPVLDFEVELIVLDARQEW